MFNSLQLYYPMCNPSPTGILETTELWKTQSKGVVSAPLVPTCNMAPSVGVAGS